MMPFRLKNVRATYQRLMDHVFKQQIERNIEMYVEDILVKSTWAKDLIGDLEETFAILWKYGLKLNPSKYIFSVTSGQFLVI